MIGNHIIYSTILFILSTNIFGQGIVINELMSDNKSVQLDIDGDFSDWIEIYNSSSSNRDLLNYSLTDDNTNLRKWIFPNITIPAHGFLLVYASGKNIYDTTELHTNFKIKKSGEELILCNAEGEITSSTCAIFLPANNSYGCIPDGSQTFSLFSIPTPNSTNTSSNSIYCSHPSGFYKNEFELLLIPANENHKIYYTLNGSKPTKSSLPYSIPIYIKNIANSPSSISLIPTTPLEGPAHLNNFKWKQPKNVYKANCIRFACFDNDTLVSKIFTKTYFIDEYIENRYTFPIISVVTDSLNLFDYNTGIYIPGKRFDEDGFNWWPEGNYHNRGKEWERNIHISFFESNGLIGFETDAGMRMRGYGSTANPQKSFGVYFRSEYGLKKINYHIFNNSNTNKYKRLVFRNSGNDFIHTHFKDALLQNLLGKLDLELQNFQPSVVFINGEYWGIHNIREKYDKYYFKYHFGIEEDNLNILGICGGIDIGNNSDYLELISFINSNNMSDNDNYLFVENKIDIQNFIDFQIAEIYYANYDWPCNNFKIWKTNNPDSKWRFLIYDLDLSFAYNNKCLYQKHSLEHATSTNNGWPHCECSNMLFRKLLENNKFEQLFIERFAFHLNKTFNSETIIDSISKFETLFTLEIEEHINRWQYPATIDKWHNQTEILRHFAQKRPCFMSNDIMAFFNLTEFGFECTPNTDSLDSRNRLTIGPNPNDGTFFLFNKSSEDFLGSITITNIAGKIVYFKNNISISENGVKYFNLTELPNNIYIARFHSSNYSEIFRIVIIK